MSLRKDEAMHHMENELDISLIKQQDISESEYTEILALCSGAYGQDFQPFLETFHDSVYVLERYKKKLVSLGIWEARWVQYPGLSPWRTAYVEALATDERYRGRGFATVVMQRLAEEIKDFDIGALITGLFDFYGRLGWKLWRGPIFFRKTDGIMSTPAIKGFMVLILPKTPDIDLGMPLSVEWRKSDF